MRKLSFLLIILLIVGCEYKATIISVHDGDSYTLDNGKRIRLKDADSPELTQPFGLEAREFAAVNLLGEEVTVKEDGESYGRKVAEIDIRGVNFAELLVSQGFAHVSLKYCRNAKLLHEYDMAKRNHIGLFSRPYQLPYNYRHNKN
jgi:micrococcal nuclease